MINPINTSICQCNRDVKDADNAPEGDKIIGIPHVTTTVGVAQYSRFRDKRWVAGLWEQL